MNAKELIGKIAVRTKAVDLKNGSFDWSYCGGSGVQIINATDEHVVIKSEFSGKPYILDSRWVNDWTEVSLLTQRSNA